MRGGSGGGSAFGNGWLVVPYSEARSIGWPAVIAGVWLGGGGLWLLACFGLPRSAGHGGGRLEGLRKRDCSLSLAGDVDAAPHGVGVSR